MSDKRGRGDLPAGNGGRLTGSGTTERPHHAVARLVISQAGRCRRGSPRCFTTCVCDGTVAAGERAPIHGDGEVRRAAELAARVAHLNDQLVPEGWEHEDAVMIAFAPGHQLRGTTALLFAGDFLLDESGMYQMVRPRTRRLLDALDIPYTTVAPES